MRWLRLQYFSLITLKSKTSSLKYQSLEDFEIIINFQFSIPVICIHTGALYVYA